MEEKYLKFQGGINMFAVIVCFTIFFITGFIVGAFIYDIKLIKFETQYEIMKDQYEDEIAKLKEKK